MKRARWLMWLWGLAVMACSSATNFILDLDGVPPLRGHLEILASEMKDARPIVMTGLGPRSRGAFTAADARILEASIRDSLIDNGIVSSAWLADPSGVTPSVRADQTLQIKLLNHVLAADRGGVMEVEWQVLSAGGQRLHGRFAAHCGFGIGNAIKNCLNRAIAYRVILEMASGLSQKAVPLPKEYSGATYFGSGMEASNRLPTTLTETECVFWVNSPYGPRCSQMQAHTISDIDWKPFLIR